MTTFRLTLEYDGRDFEGWQLQAEGCRTVQGTLEVALESITGERPRVAGASRTDAGVHAEGQVASFRAHTRLDAAALRCALNAVLPRDIAALSLEEAHDDFHARRDARSKLYRYAIWNGPYPSPLRADRSLRVERRLDLGAMREAAAALRGIHDFTSFQAAGSSVRTALRTLSRMDVVEAAPGEVLLFIEADGFLRHMVRILVGTLVEVGRGRRPAACVPAVLAGRDRRAAGPTAAAQALTLVRVVY